MELKLTNTIGKLGLPITEVYNKERVKYMKHMMIYHVNSGLLNFLKRWRHISIYQKEILKKLAQF